MENGITKIALLNVPYSARIPTGLTGETGKGYRIPEIEISALALCNVIGRGHCKIHVQPDSFSG